MILTRFWLLLLSLLVAFGVTVALVATHLVREERARTTTDALRRDQLEMMMLLRHDARARLDAIGPIAANQDIRTGLRSRRNDAARARVRTKLAELNAQLGELSGDIIFAVDRDGVIIGQAGGLAAASTYSGIGAFPAVRRALAGFLRDDVWLFNGDVYRIAARPVVESGDYVGAIVHAKRFDRVFAARLAERLLAGVAFFREHELITFAAPSSADLVPNESEFQAALQQLDTAALATSEQGVSSPVGEGSGKFLYPPGTAQTAHFGVALLRKSAALPSPFALLESASAEDFQRIPLWIAGSVFALLFLLGMLFVWLERDRPLKKFHLALRKIADRNETRMSASAFGGPLRMLAASVNDALDGASPAPQQSSQDLDAILGAPKSAAEPSFYGFADSNVQNNVVNTPTAPPPAKEPLFTRSQPPAARPSIPQPPGRMPAPPTRTSVPHQASANATLPLTPSPSMKPSSRPLPPKPPMPSGNTSPSINMPVNPSSTHVGMPVIPQAMGAGPVQAGARRISNAGDSEEAETSIQGRFDADADQHRTTYQQYLAAKEECGETIEGLTFDRFLATVRKQEQQITIEHGAARVVFSVYIKDGKAKLKASPQRT